MEEFNCARCGEMHPICDHHQPKDNPRLDVLLEEARQCGASVSSVCDNRGMASVTLAWHPYECMWFASCSWSDGSVIKKQGDNVVQVVDDLTDELAREYCRCHREWIKSR